MLPVAARFALAGATAGADEDDDEGPDGDAAAGATPEAAAGEIATSAAYAMEPTVIHAVVTAMQKETSDRVDRLD